MKLTSLSIVFPAYNEEKNITKTLRQALLVGNRLTDDLELIVVDDGSRDGTARMVSQMVEQDGRIFLITHLENRGYGQTVWHGLQSATKSWVFFSDSDRQFNLSELSKFVHFQEDFSVVIGYRYPRRDPAIRIISGQAWNLLVRLLFDLKVKDIDCAFKLIKRSTLEDLTIISGGATFSAELLLRLQQQGHSFKEVPEIHRPRRVGSQTGIKPQVVWRAFRELFALYRTSNLGRTIYRDIFRFALVGVVITVFDIVTLNAFYLYAHLTLYWATFFGFLVGSVSGYWLNNRWTYRRLNKKSNLAGLVQYTIIGAIGLIITELLMHQLAVRSGLNYNLSKLVAVAVVFFWNFFGNRYLTFNIIPSKKVIPNIRENRP